jgi:hypothetical protein
MTAMRKAIWKGSAAGALFWMVFIGTVLLGSLIEYGV